jgi:hypothetical protein
MRTKQIIPGLANTHKFRAIVNGVGFYMTPKQMVEMPFTTQRVAVWTALESCVNEKITGVVKTVKSYDYNMKPVEVTVQITL